MARRLQVPASDDDDDAAPTQTARPAIKTEKRRTRAKVTVQDEEEDDQDQQHPDENGVEQEDEPISRGTKRRRINGDGDSLPSRAVSQEPEGEGEGEGEDEQNVASQIPKVEVKTQPRDTDGYIPGSIVRIRLENFVTYDAVEFRPGAYLNMIIGPNGTGKSSIACAICLGLNFPPSVLGRASEVKDFVKAGTTEGFIEIELKAPKGRPNLVVRRNLRADKKTSSFTLNGKSSSGAEIRNRVAELNVQVGNLCTFLPQDKVSSFAAMSPQELLKETQLAAGDSRLTNWHSQLIKSGKEIRDLKVHQNTDEAAKAQAQQRVDMMEHTVRLFNERRELEKQQAVLQCVIEVERYRVVHLKFTRVKAQHRALNEVVRRLKEKNDPVRNHLENLRAQATQWQEEVNSGHETQRKRLGKFSNLHSQLEDLADGIETTYQKIDALEKEEENKLKNMKKFEADIQATEAELKKPPPQTEDPLVLKAEEEQAQSDKFNLDQRHGDLKKELARHVDGRARASVELENAEARIKSFDDTDTIKLQNMLRWSKDTHDAILWLRKNQHLFKMEIMEPPYMCMTVPDKRYQAAVESLINSAQLRTFVAQCKEDVNLLNQCINDSPGLGRKAKIVTWYMDYNEQRLPPPPVPHERMRALGFDGYALEYVDFPAGLNWFLRRECNFHRNAITINPQGVNVGNAMEELGNPETGGGASFVCGNTLNVLQRSRYGSRALNNMTRDIPRARNLTVQTVDPEVRRQAEETVRRCQEALMHFDEERKVLDQRLADIMAEDKKIEERLKGIKKRKDAIRDAQKGRVSLENRLKRLKGQLTSLKNQPSEESKKKKLNRELMQKNFQRAEKVKEIITLMRSFIPEQEAFTLLKLKLMQANANITALEKLVEEKDLKFKEAFDRYTELNERYLELKAEGKALLKRANDAIGNRTDPEMIAESDRMMEVRKEYFAQLSEYEKQLEEAGGGPEAEEELRRQGVEKPEPGERYQEGDVRSLDELEIACRTVEEQLEYNNNRDESVVRSYEEKKALVESLTTAIEQRQQKIDTTEAKIRRTQKQWEPALRALIQQIREKFSDAFDRIGCAGDVELMPDPDYAQWRVDIKVKFRDHEKLQLLTGQRQSGGERSLTTILYLMSLTSLAHTPFSLVDEINQGMDKRAERTVHNSMVDVTCEEDSSQYFLITPKLLPDLKYHPRMKVLCINNGEWLPENVSGNMKTMLSMYVAAHPVAA